MTRYRCTWGDGGITPGNNQRWGGSANQPTNLRDAGVRATIHAGEPGASIPAVRAKIEEAWGAKCFDHNGMTEVGAMGFSCAGSPGNIHLNEGEFFVEIYRKTGMDELNIKLEINQNRHPAEEIDALVKRIGAHLKSQLQIGVDLEPVPAGALPRFEMKAKRFVREIRRD